MHRDRAGILAESLRTLIAKRCGSAALLPLSAQPARGGTFCPLLWAVAAVQGRVSFRSWLLSVPVASPCSFHSGLFRELLVWCSCGIGPVGSVSRSVSFCTGACVLGVVDDVAWFEGDSQGKDLVFDAFSGGEGRRCRICGDCSRNRRSPHLADRNSWNPPQGLPQIVYRNGEVDAGDHSPVVCFAHTGGIDSDHAAVFVRAADRRCSRGSGMRRFAGSPGHPVLPR